jgi:hypothetical protein
MPNTQARSPNVSAIERVSASALQARSVNVERMDGYLYRTYRLTTAKGFFYIMRCQPSDRHRLLRHEENRIPKEAGSLQTLNSCTQLVTARLIGYQNTKTQNQIGSQYLISGPFTGSILEDLEPKTLRKLSQDAVTNIDHSLGLYVRRMAGITGPAFGPLRQDQGSPSQTSWSRAFLDLLEPVLSDGEDALINLPYEGMRELVRRHRSSLDKVTQPRLVILELSGDSNVVVDPRTTRVTGLLDYSTAHWGDPYMSDIFLRPTEGFRDGFGRLPNADADERIRQYL